MCQDSEFFLFFASGLSSSDASAKFSSSVSLVASLLPPTALPSYEHVVILICFKRSHHNFRIVLLPHLSLKLFEGKYERFHREPELVFRLDQPHPLGSHLQKGFQDLKFISTATFNDIDSNSESDSSELSWSSQDFHGTTYDFLGMTNLWEHLCNLQSALSRCVRLRFCHFLQGASKDSTVVMIIMDKD